MWIIFTLQRIILSVCKYLKLSLFPADRFKKTVLNPDVPIYYLYLNTACALCTLNID